MTQKRVLIVQHHSAEGPGTLAAWLAQKELQMEVVNWTDALPQRLECYQALVVLGGPMNANSKEARIQDEINVLQSFIHQNKPVLGICLGAQLLVKALGGVVSCLNESEAGWSEIETNTGIRLMVPQWHSQTFSLPSAAQLLASSANCRNQMFMLGKNLFGIQFHPEWDNQSIRQLQLAFGKNCPLNPTSVDQQDTLRGWWFGELDRWWNGCYL